MNDTVGFTVVATIENGVLKYVTTKTFTKRNYPALDWTKMTSCLKEAYDLSLEKVVFKIK